MSKSVSQVLWYYVLFTIYYSVLLQNIPTITVTTETPEKSFFSLGKLLIYMRSIILEEKLNGLAVFNVHEYFINWCQWSDNQILKTQIKAYEGRRLVLTNVWCISNNLQVAFVLFSPCIFKNQNKTTTITLSLKTFLALSVWSF